jgi:hypothetical protein
MRRVTGGRANDQGFVRTPWKFAPQAALRTLSLMAPLSECSILAIDSLRAFDVAILHARGATEDKERRYNNITRCTP